MTMLEDRIRSALAAEAQAWSDPTPQRGQRRKAKSWAVAVMAAAAVLVLVGGVALLVPRTPDPSIPTLPAQTTPTTSAPATSSTEPVAGFSQADADAMTVTAATYGFDFDALDKRIGFSQGPPALTDADLTPDLVDIVRAAASEALAAIGAPPPYEARVIDATDEGTWEVFVTASYSAGRCFVFVDESRYGTSACRGDEAGLADPVLLGFGDSGWGVLPEDATFVVGDWLLFAWWGLPDETAYVLHRTTSPTGAESQTSAAPVLDGMVGITKPVAGVGHVLHIEAHRADDTVVLDASAQIPAFTTDDDVQAEPDERIVYESDATSFAPLIGGGETFLGGGYVLGEPWAIVGRTSAVEGKETLHCTGVRPIRDEDFCAVPDGLSWLALPVGDLGGVLVFRVPNDADVIRVMFDDGTMVEAPFVGGNAGYPHTAVVPIEAAGARGTAYVVGAEGNVLWARPFEVTEFVNPGG